MTVAFRYVVSGRVQGVGFRFFSRHAAESAGLTGWVRNLSDGRVEALVEGPRTDVEGFEATLRQGPGMAKVTDVTGEELPQPQGHKRFRIAD